MTCIVYCSNPVADVRHVLSLEVERPCWRDKPKRVLMLLQHDLGARVDVGELEQPEEFVFGGRLVERQVCWAQHEPTLLPCLTDVGRDLRRIEIRVGHERTPGAGGARARAQIKAMKRAEQHTDVPFSARPSSRGIQP